MALTKRVEIDRIEIVGDTKHVQIRTATVIEEDGVEISRAFHRRVIDPDSDVSLEVKELRDIASIVHTPEVKQKWSDKKSSKRINLGGRMKL